jgi:hypothetical protein
LVPARTRAVAADQRNDGLQEFPEAPFGNPAFDDYCNSLPPSAVERLSSAAASRGLGVEPTSACVAWAVCCSRLFALVRLFIPRHERVAR